MPTKVSSSVVTKTTNPQVVIQTKKLLPSPDAALTASTFCGKGNWIWKLCIILLLVANVVISLLTYFTSREQFRFTVMSNGGIENYQMLQNLYASPAFHQASTLSIYQLIERIDQTLASAQEQPAEDTSLQQ